MRDDIYTLPRISFVAGQTVTLRWNLYDSDGDPFDANGFTGNFAVVEFSNKTDDAILSKDLSFELGDNDDGVYNLATVTLDPSDTLDWDGKYVYQLIIVSDTSDVEIPNQGIIYAYRNINQAYLE